MIFFASAAPFLAVIAWASVAQVPAGHVGVMTLFGKVTGEVLPQGLHLMNPLKQNHLMSVRTQELKEQVRVPTADGLVVTVDIAMLFRLPPGKAADVVRTIGPGYADVVVDPTLRSAIRATVAAHSTSALAAADREVLARQVRERVETELAPRGVVVEQVLLRDLQLPPE